MLETFEDLLKIQVILDGASFSTNWLAVARSERSIDL